MKTALLGMPSYGLCSPSACRGLYRASNNSNMRVIVPNFESSLLAQGFNVLWCGALNECAAGRKVDYFAMIHSDVEPEDGWLDVMIDELESHRLDVLSSVVAIKNSMGLTSSGYEADPFDEWRIGGRLTMKEVHRLPTTFTAEHVGRPLVMNTGLWVCRFNPDWAKQVCFTIRDRIVQNPDGTSTAEVMPEDWGVSRQFRALGLKMGITRRVKVGHRGPFIFGNDKPWGTYDHDEAYVKQSIIP